MISAVRGRGKLMIVPAVAVLALAAAGAGAEQANRSVVAGVASAQGVRTTMRATGFIVEELADGGGPVAQALVDPQDSKSFASLPYPGENAVAVPGVVAAVGGPTLPAYPFYATASTSEPEQEVGDPGGGYRLSAKAAPGTAAGTATVQTPGDKPTSSARASAAVLTNGDRTTSRAEVLMQGLELGDGALRIASLRSISETVYTSGADPKSATELLIEGATAGPLSFTYGQDGLAVSKQGVPVPTDEALAALNQALAPAGLSIGFAKAHDVAGGRSSEALVVEQTGDIVNGSRSFVRYRLGEAASGLVLGDRLPGPAPTDGLGPVVAPPADASAEGSSGSTVASDAEQADTAGSFPLPTPRPAASSAAGGFNPARPSAPSGLWSEPVPAATGVAAPPASDQSVAAAPAGAFPVTPRRISSVEPLSGLLVAAAAAMVAIAALWTKRGALTP